ncbi:MAG: hypothetical protein QXS20_05625 [Candidatus Thorarchaeota archaeon]
MEQDDIIQVAGVMMVVLALAAAWITNASGLVGYVTSSVGAVGGTLLILRVYRRHEDERLRHILLLSARNSALFVFLALPLTMGLLIARSGMSEGVAAMFVLWILALAVYYLSTICYYRR